MARTLHAELTPTTGLTICTSDRSDGSLRVTEPCFLDHLAQLWSTPADVTWLKQVHGDRIVVVEKPGEHVGSEADGAFTTEVGVTLAITTADCAPIVIAAADDRSRALAIVHAGWRGLLAGIIERAARMVAAEVPDGQRYTFCGPCIGPDHYEFSAHDLAPLVERYGEPVRSRTVAGTESLDLFAGVTTALETSGFPTPSRPPTTAARSYFSHRTGGADRSSGRMLTLARLLHT